MSRASNSFRDVRGNLAFHGGVLDVSQRGFNASTMGRAGVGAAELLSMWRREWDLVKMASAVECGNETFCCCSDASASGSVGVVDVATKPPTPWQSGSSCGMSGQGQDRHECGSRWQEVFVLCGSGESCRSQGRNVNQSASARRVRVGAGHSIGSIAVSSIAWQRDLSRLGVCFRHGHCGDVGVVAGLGPGKCSSPSRLGGKLGGLD